MAKRHAHNADTEPDLFSLAERPKPKAAAAPEGDPAPFRSLAAAR